jgi:RNA-binding protein 5/10
MSPQIHPNGFRVSDKPVAASFAHPYSFQPIENQMMRDEASVQSSMGLGGVEGVWVRYWDEGSTAAILEFKVEEPAPAAAPTKEKKKKSKGNTASFLRYMRSSLTSPRRGPHTSACGGFYASRLGQACDPKLQDLVRGQEGPRCTWYAAQPNVLVSY